MIDHSAIGKAITRRSLEKWVVPEETFSRVGPIARYPNSKVQQRFVEANRERIDAEWEALPDGRAHVEQRRFAADNKTMIDADWENEGALPKA